MAAPAIGALGELLVEFVAEDKGTRHLRPTRYAGPFPSGAPGIFIDQAARQGARAHFAGAVGDDAFGRVVLDRLAQAGVARGLIRTVPGLPTGSAFVAYDADGSRDFVFNIAQSAAARLPAADEIAAGFAAAGVGCVHVSGSVLGDPSMRATVVAVCAATKARGARVSLDPNLRAELTGDPGYRAALEGLLGIADYVLPSDADAEALWPGAFDDWAPGLLARGARAVVLKRGADGAVGLDATGRHAVAGHAVPVVDPTGAGDSFCATLVTALEGGAPLGDALIRANAAGALAVQALGPMEGNSTPAEIDAFLGGRG